MGFGRCAVRARRSAVGAALFLGLGWPRVEAAPVAPTPTAEAVPVRVERVKPLGERLPMLRFLRDNRDFLRGRSDALRGRPGAHAGAAAALDPRLVDYPALRDAARREEATTTAAADSLARRELLGRFQEVLDLEAEMGRLEARFAGAGERMARLERDFGATPLTALVLLVRGLPEAPVDSLVVMNDLGERWALALSGETASGLRQGGLARLFHEFVEPREQRLTLCLTGAAWRARPSDVLVFEPQRDRATVLEIDLSAVRPAADGPAPGARGWIDEPPIGVSNALESGH